MNHVVAEDFSRFTMIAVNTEQNIVNLLPAVQLGLRKVHLLSSPFAKERKLGEGLTKVLRERGVTVQESAFGNPQDSIEGLTSWLGDLNIAAPRLWNLGGGLKSQQIALWRFLEKQVGDWAIYTRTDEKTILIEVTPAGIKEYPPIATDILPCPQPLQIEDIVNIFARKLVPPNDLEKSPLEDRSKYPCFMRELEKFRTNREYRLSWYRQLAGASSTDLSLPSSTRDLQHWLKNVAKNPFKKSILGALNSQVSGRRINHSLENVTNAIFNAIFSADTWKKIWEIPPPNHLPNEFTTATIFWPKYFEYLVQTIVMEQLPRSSKFSKEVLFNWKVERQDNAGIPEQEHDVLLMGRSGTLFSIDAKTAGSDTKDLNSRILQFERTSGRLARFLVAIPLFLEDLHFDECMLIRKIPFKMAEIKQPFLVVTNEPSTFYLAPPETPGGIPTQVQKGTPGALECRRLEDLFQG
ncbi:MAG: hypothetical protein RMJ98_12965 [Myxococcales bacterium]|nr:hypothetical protein [Polyangiaceae bacterium]MDW8250198.1 hypothetical protein [Myxococcales bacterium]